MECSNKEAMIDLVCCIRTSPHHGVHRFQVSPSHRFRMVDLKCQIGRHQESERCRAGLDKLERYIAEPACCTST
jgi:hypothetical protein